MNLPITDNIRAHHVRDLFIQYCLYGDVPRIESGFLMKFPLEILDYTDDFCEKRCPNSSYPVINFCRGPETRKLDEKWAKILGLAIGRKYTREGLRAIFEAKRKEHRIVRGENLRLTLNRFLQNTGYDIEV